MITLITTIGSLLIGVAFLLLGSGLLNTLVALRSELEGYSSAVIGGIMSGYFIGFFVGTYLALPLINRVGHIRAFAFCAAIVAISVLMHTLLISPAAWLLIRILTGIALVILYTIIEGWLNGQTPPENRGKVFAVYMTVNLGAIALAQQLLRIDQSISFTLFAISAILICLSLMPITWTRMQQPEIHNVSRIKLTRLFRIAPVALIGSLLSGLAMGAFWGLSALYANRIGLTNNDVATFMSCAILGGALLQFPIGRYSDSHDRRMVLAVISFCAAMAALVTAVVPSDSLFIYLSIALYGGLAFAVYPIAVAHMVDHLDPEDMLGGGSNMLLLHGVGAMLGPALAGQLMQLTTPTSLPVYWAIMQFALAAGAIFFINRGKVEHPSDHNAEFVPMVRTTPTALEMLPADEFPLESDDAHAMWGAGADQTQAETPQRPGQ